MASRNRIKWLVCCLCPLSAVTTAVGQTDLKKFPLMKAIPSNVFIAVAAKHNPEREFLDTYWARVHTAFMESGILNDCWEMISDSMDDSQLDQVEEVKGQFSELCHAVDWCDIFSREVIHAGRYVMPFRGSPYEGVLLGRMDEEKAAANHEAIKALMGQLQKFVESRGGKGHVSLREVEKDGWTMSVFGPVEAPNVGLAVAHHDDVIAFGFGGLGMLEECMGLLRSHGAAKALVATARFKEAVSMLPPAEDSLFFFDVSEMLLKVKGMMAMAGGEHRGPTKKAGKAARKNKTAKEVEDEDADTRDEKPGDDSDEAEDDEDDEDEKMGIAIITKVMDEIAMFDCIASSERTEGYRVFSDSVVMLSGDAKSKRLYPALTSCRPIKNFQRFIPKEAGSFSVGGGVHLGELYRAGRGFVKDVVPGGKEKLAEFDRMQEEVWGLDIQKDIIDLIGGSVVTVTMGSDWVFMLEVTDEQKAYSQVRRLADLIQERTGKEGGLMLAPVDIAGNKFTSISHPMMMMVGFTSSPVWGCAEGHFILGSSSKAVKRCLATASGEHANITKNKRFMAQGLLPRDGAIESVSFTDERTTGDDLQGLINGLSMASGMMGMFGAGDMPPEVSNFITRIPPIVAKLGPVAAKMNFYESSAEYSTFENDRWMSHSVQNYKAPKDVLDEEEGAGASEDSMKSSDDDDDSPRKSKSKPRRSQDDGDDDDGDE